MHRDRLSSGEVEGSAGQLLRNKHGWVIAPSTPTARTTTRNYTLTIHEQLLVGSIRAASETIHCTEEIVPIMPLSENEFGVVSEVWKYDKHTTLMTKNPPGSHSCCAAVHRPNKVAIR